MSTPNENLDHGTIVSATCVECGKPIKLVGWIGEQRQDNSVYVHDYPGRHPDEPERCIGTPNADSHMAYEVALPQESIDAIV